MPASVFGRSQKMALTEDKTKVHFLGRLPMQGSRQEDTWRPVDALVNSKKNMVKNMKMKVSNYGINRTYKWGLGSKKSNFIPLDRVVYGGVDDHHERVFTLIVRGDQQNECHAYLCENPADAEHLTMRLDDAFRQAYGHFEEEGVHREAPRDNNIIMAPAMAQPPNGNANGDIEMRETTQVSRRRRGSASSSTSRSSSDQEVTSTRVVYSKTVSPTSDYGTERSREISRDHVDIQYNNYQNGPVEVHRQPEIRQENMYVDRATPPPEPRRAQAMYVERAAPPPEVRRETMYIERAAPPPAVMSSVIVPDEPVDRREVLSRTVYREPSNDVYMSNGFDRQSIRSEPRYYRSYSSQNLHREVYSQPLVRRSFYRSSPQVAQLNEYERNYFTEDGDFAVPLAGWDDERPHYQGHTFTREVATQPRYRVPEPRAETQYFRRDGSYRQEPVYHTQYRASSRVPSRAPSRAPSIARSRGGSTYSRPRSIFGRSNSKRIEGARQPSYLTTVQSKSFWTQQGPSYGDSMMY
ncbi:Hypp493 [Branchiostoma lanceolatum]|uniref:Hypp493 protein n=1 Tax=Branchiostoma lanceolatum TaxID=7740 RepID=A0A8J9YL84_BRALA|nr:Hypp493 [Branchiostoma lanceolatum]